MAGLFPKCVMSENVSQWSGSPHVFLGFFTLTFSLMDTVRQSPKREHLVTGLRHQSYARGIMSSLSPCAWFQDSEKCNPPGLYWKKLLGDLVGQAFSWWAQAQRSLTPLYSFRKNNTDWFHRETFPCGWMASITPYLFLKFPIIFLGDCIYFGWVSSFLHC